MANGFAATENGTVVITGEGIPTYAMMVVTKGIEFYLKYGRLLNRSYTPTNMRAYVSRYTGKSYARSRKGLEKAYVDLVEVLAARQQ
jgi:hypothetical protein